MKTSIAVGNRRLLKLARFLRKLPRHKFNLSGWATCWDRKHKCGTVCCALGWMPTVDPRQWRWLPHNQEPCLRHSRVSDPFEAGARYFGITPGQAGDLFLWGDPPSAVTPKQEAAKIEAFVRARS